MENHHASIWLIYANMQVPTIRRLRLVNPTKTRHHATQVLENFASELHHSLITPFPLRRLSGSCTYTDTILTSLTDTPLSPPQVLEKLASELLNL